jgi:hypothetical protein
VTVTIIEDCAFDGVGLERMNLLDLKMIKAGLDGITRVEFLAFGSLVEDVCFSGAASLRSLTFGRISADDCDSLRCGGHPVQARCLTLDGRLPRSLESVLRVTHLFAELGAATKRMACPVTPP